MKKVIVAFDVDGTLINNGYLASNGGGPVANERIRTLLITLASFKNVHILVWSGGGELYARQIASVIGIQKYVDQYADKNYIQCKKCNEETRRAAGCSHHSFKPSIVPDIAIDDIQACELGLINLIVREK